MFYVVLKLGAVRSIKIIKKVLPPELKKNWTLIGKADNPVDATEMKLEYRRRLKEMDKALRRWERQGKKLRERPAAPAFKAFQALHIASKPGYPSTDNLLGDSHGP